MSTAKIQKLLLLVSKSSEISTLRRTSATPVSSAHPSATSIPASPALSNRHPRHPVIPGSTGDLTIILLDNLYFCFAWQKARTAFRRSCNLLWQHGQRDGAKVIKSNKKAKDIQHHRLTSFDPFPRHSRPDRPSVIPGSDRGSHLHSYFVKITDHNIPIP